MFQSFKKCSFLRPDKTLLQLVVQRGLVRRGASLLWLISFDFDPLLSVLRL